MDRARLPFGNGLDHAANSQPEHRAAQPGRHPLTTEDHGIPGERKPLEGLGLVSQEDGQERVQFTT